MYRDKRIVLFCVAILFGSEALRAQLPAASANKKSGEAFKNVQVLTDVPSDLLLPSMQFITSSLGVHCEYCHVENAFEKDDKKSKQTARAMMKMVREINSANFEGHQKVTCYSCHRGQPKPLAIPTVAATTPHLLNDPPVEPTLNPPELPNPEEVVKRYKNALGGEAALSKLASIEQQGTFQADTRAFPVDVFKEKSGKMATITHFSGHDSITVLDGTSGWVLLPQRPSRSMTLGEVDAGIIDLDLEFAPDLKQIFPELAVSSIVKIESNDTVLLLGKRPGVPPVEMYFDSKSGLLVRIVHYLPSALGSNPIQTDYSDYRLVGGVKVPFRWTTSTPTGRFSIQISSAKPNTAIPQEILSKAEQVGASSSPPTEPR